MGNNLHIGAWAADLDDNGNIWVSCYDFNGLYKYDIKQNKVQLIHRFHQVSLEQEELHSELCVRGNEIFAFPCKDKKIRVFDMSDQTEDSIELPFQNDLYCTEIVRNDDVWIFSAANMIYKFSMKTKKFSEKDDLCDLINKKIKTYKPEECSITVGDNTIMLFCGSEKLLFEFHIDDDSEKKYDLNMIPNSIFRVIYRDAKHWILLKDSHDIFSFEDTLDDLRQYHCPDGTFLPEKQMIPYSDLIEMDGEFILLNYYSERLMKVCMSERSIKPFRQQRGRIRGLLSYGAMYTKGLKYKESLSIIPQRADKLLIYSGGKISEFSFEIEDMDESSINEFRKKYFSKHKVVKESDFGLSEFLNFIEREKSYKENIC